jgi:hypothetical protein
VHGDGMASVRTRSKLHDPVHGNPGRKARAKKACEERTGGQEHEEGEEGE